VLKNTLKGYLVVFLLKQINITIMESHHLDFMSPANETPREKNFDDVYLQLDREDALIVEEHLNNIPRVSLNFKNCLKFMHKYLVNAVIEGNYTVVNKTDCILIILINEISCDLWIGNGASSFCFYDNHFTDRNEFNSFLNSFTFTELEKKTAYNLAILKSSKPVEMQKSEIQQEIDLLTAKMNAL
jgi:hypothetical protein